MFPLVLSTCRHDGPLGPPCVLPRPVPHMCYDSCLTYHECDPVNTCEHSSCYDDVTFARAVIYYINDHYCLDQKSVHMQGRRVSEWSRLRAFL